MFRALFLTSPFCAVFSPWTIYWTSDSHCYFSITAICLGFSAWDVHCLLDIVDFFCICSHHSFAHLLASMPSSMYFSTEYLKCILINSVYSEPLYKYLILQSVQPISVFFWGYSSPALWCHHYLPDLLIVHLFYPESLYSIGFQDTFSKKCSKSNYQYEEMNVAHAKLDVIILISVGWQG